MRLARRYDKATEWQGIADEIDAAFICARADFVTCMERTAVGYAWLGTGASRERLRCFA